MDALRGQAVRGDAEAAVGSSTRLNGGKPVVAPRKVAPLPVERAAGTLASSGENGAHAAGGTGAWRRSGPRVDLEARASLGHALPRRLPMLREAVMGRLAQLGKAKQDGCIMGLLRRHPEMSQAGCSESEKERLAYFHYRDFNISAAPRGDGAHAGEDSSSGGGGGSASDSASAAGGASVAKKTLLRPPPSEQPQSMGHPFETANAAMRARHTSRHGPYWERLHLNHSTSESTVFVALASFRDRECPRTLESAFRNAANASRIFIGIVQQTSEKEFNAPFDLDCLDVYCERVGEANCRRDQVRVSRQRAEDSEGVCVTRYDSQQLLGEETFFLQVDSHTLFAREWDSRLIDNWKQTGNPHGILTAYPMADDRLEKPWLDGVSNYKLVPRICRLFNNGNALANHGAGDITVWTETPEKTAFWAAGLSFSLADSEREVPYDQHMPYVFMGEEPSRALRLYTHGWDFYIPSDNTIFHYYKREGAPRLEGMRHFSAPELAIKRDMGANRVWHLFGMPVKGRIETAGLAPGEAFALGDERSRQQYLDRAGFVLHTYPAEDGKSNKTQWLGQGCGCSWALEPEPLASQDAAGASRAAVRAGSFSTRERLMCCNIAKPGGKVHLRAARAWESDAFGGTAKWAGRAECAAGQSFGAPIGGEGLSAPHAAEVQGGVVTYPSWNGTMDELVMQHVKVYRDRDTASDGAADDARLLCVIATTKEEILTGLATAAWRTWGKRCHGVMFVSEYTTATYRQQHPGYASAEAVLDPFPAKGRQTGEATELFDTLSELACRSVMRDGGFTHLLVARADAFVVVENVLMMLDTIDEEAGEPLFAGRATFEVPVPKQKRDTAQEVGRLPEGMGDQVVLSGMYLLNSAGLDAFADARAGWRGVDKRVSEGECKENRASDLALSACLRRGAGGVLPADTRDAQGRERFHAFSGTFAALMAAASETSRFGWYATRSLGPLRDGLAAVAPSSVAFKNLDRDDLESYERGLYGGCQSAEQQAERRTQRERRLQGFW